MPERKSETILKAFYAALQGALPAGATHARNGSLPAKIPAAGHAVLRDGDPGDPEVTLSPLAYHYEHRAEVEVLIELPPATREEAFDAMVRAVGAVILVDRTLGGLCDWIEGEAPAPLSIAIEGAEGWKAATITVLLHYTSSDPLV